MTRTKHVRWGRWAGAIAAALVLLKSAAFVIAKLFGLAKNEVQARGGDVNFVLGLAERRKHARG
jgi:hypothetical protein